MNNEKKLGEQGNQGSRENHRNSKENTSEAPVHKTIIKFQVTCKKCYRGTKRYKPRGASLEHIYEHPRWCSDSTPCSTVIVLKLRHPFTAFHKKKNERGLLRDREETQQRVFRRPSTRPSHRWLSFGLLIMTSIHEG